MKKASKSAVNQSFWYITTPFLTPTFSAVKTPENTEENSDVPEPADDADIQMEYSFAQFYRPSIQALTQNYL
jgi:hypothetical protein